MKPMENGYVESFNDRCVKASSLASIMPAAPLLNELTITTISATLNARVPDPGRLRRIIRQPLCKMKASRFRQSLPPRQLAYSKLPRRSSPLDENASGRSNLRYLRARDR